MENIIYGYQRLFTDFLEIANNFEMSLKFQPKEKETKQFMKGMEIGCENFFKILAKNGFNKIKTNIGDFYNSEKHEIFNQKCLPKSQQNIILEITQTGYVFHDRVLQPTKIIINSCPKNEKV